MRTCLASSGIMSADILGASFIPRLDNISLWMCDSKSLSLRVLDAASVLCRNLFPLIWVTIVSTISAWAVWLKCPMVICVDFLNLDPSVEMLHVMDKLCIVNTLRRSYIRFWKKGAKNVFSCCLSSYLWLVEHIYIILICPIIFWSTLWSEKIIIILIWSSGCFI